MSFLAFTFGQVALITAVTMGAIIALYVLKLRRRRVVVSSSIVWQRVLDQQRSYTRLERLRTVISIAMAVLTALLIALSLGRPQLESVTGNVQRVVIVLDSSPSMNTRTRDGRTRWAHAVDRANDLVANSSAEAEIRIADTSGETTSAFTADRTEARRLLNTLKPGFGRPRFPAVERRNSRIFFVSDGVGVRDIPRSVQSVSVFERAHNVAITAFDVRPVPSSTLEYEAFLELENYGPAATVDLTLEGAGQERVRRSIKVASDSAFRDVFDLSGIAGGAIRASIRADHDDLEADNAAFAYMPMRRRTRVLLVTPGNPYLETVLKLDRDVDVSVVQARDYQQRPDVDAYVFDRFAPPEAPSRPALLIGAPTAPWLRPLRGWTERPEISTWSETHPILQYVSLQDVAITRAMRIDPGDLTVLAASRQAPLIVASERPRWVMLTFDLASSDFPQHAGFPVFVQNVLAWLNGQQLAVRRSPGAVEVPLPDAQVRSADGRIVASEHHLGSTVFHAEGPGLYTAAQGDTELHVAVNIADPELSNINQSGLMRSATIPRNGSLVRRGLWVYMLWGALGLLTLEWFTYHRRVTL